MAPSHAAQVSNGQNFGELALMYDQPRAATVRAKSGGKLWALARVPFKVFLIMSNRNQAAADTKYGLTRHEEACCC